MTHALMLRDTPAGVELVGEAEDRIHVSQELLDVADRLRTDENAIWIRRAFEEPGRPDISPPRRHDYLARVRRDDGGPPVVDALVLTGPDIDATTMRAFGVRTALALADLADEDAWAQETGMGERLADLFAAWDTRGETPQPPAQPDRPRLTRPDGTDPEGFSRRVAQAYREATLATSTPAKALAEEAGVPVTTVHRWIRDARRAGVLGAARKGRAG